MRLPEIERGDGLESPAYQTYFDDVGHTAAGCRQRNVLSPGVFQHAAWLRMFHATMRRSQLMEHRDGHELMSSQVAKWNSCPFCIGVMERLQQRRWNGGLLITVVADYSAGADLRSAQGRAQFLGDPLTPVLLNYLVVAKGSSSHRGECSSAEADAAAITTVFNIVTRYASALDFAMPSASRFMTSRLPCC